MTMWKIFDADPSLRDQGPSAMRIIMKPYGAWERYQRNRYVEHLFDAGLDDAEVGRRLDKQLRDPLKESMIRHLRNRAEHRDKARKKHVARQHKKR